MKALSAAAAQRLERDAQVAIEKLIWKVKCRTCGAFLAMSVLLFSDGPVARWCLPTRARLAEHACVPETDRPDIPPEHLRKQGA
jgi:hypothetical protein